jgi:hypothetical protein
MSSRAERLDRIALVVDDVDGAAADLERIFGMRFKVFDVESMGIRVGLGNDGIELVQKIGESHLEALWKPPLAAIVMRVADVEACAAKMAELGVAIDHRVDTGGMREISFGTNFRGLPLVVCDGDEDVAGAVELEPDGSAHPTVTHER